MSSLTPIPQLTREDLASMTRDEIMAARRAGKLAAVMGYIPRPEFPIEGQLGHEEWEAMTRAERHAAIRRGQFATYIQNYRKGTN